MPDFCDASATNGSGSRGANFTAGGCKLFANPSREAGDSVRETEHFGILAIARRIQGQRDVPADHPELHALLISVRQVLIDRLARISDGTRVKEATIIKADRTFSKMRQSWLSRFWLDKP